MCAHKASQAFLPGRFARQNSDPSTGDLCFFDIVTNFSVVFTSTTARSCKTSISIGSRRRSKIWWLKTLTSIRHSSVGAERRIESEQQSLTLTQTHTHRHKKSMHRLLVIWKMSAEDSRKGSPELLLGAVDFFCISWWYKKLNWKICMRFLNFNKPFSIIGFSIQVSI